MLDHNGQLVSGNGYIIDDLTDHAIDFIKSVSQNQLGGIQRPGKSARPNGFGTCIKSVSKNTAGCNKQSAKSEQPNSSETCCKQDQEQPFFVYLPYNTPHSPMQVPDRWWDKFQDKKLTMPHRYSKRESLPHTRAALAMCENIDWNVGRVLETLEKLKLVDNTIVVYFSDNGPNGFRWNGEMRGKKGSTDEGGVRSPLLIRWPDNIPAGLRFKQIAGAIDLLPTLAELASIELKSPKPLDGVSLGSTLLAGKSELPAERMLFSHWNHAVSVRTQQFRLDHEGRLYDMQQNPSQHRDVSKQHPKVTADLKQAATDWKTELLANRSKQPRPFLVGHQDSRYTQLPARDAVAHGGIKRSCRHPNCSFLFNWQNTSDKITWDVEVLEPGKYEAQIYYTCAKSDIGSTIELSFGESKLTGTVQTANDPPLRGMEHDRVKRVESYVKDFKPMKLGTIELTGGTGQLTLQATKIAGENAMDFRLLLLTRAE
ncbi:MAG: sulfatase-like hydrolase/transferase [Planctomycetes bacterium]|nr:sulfatase-like hydrolase/transferase [Planctomycetota bacterium]